MCVCVREREREAWASLMKSRLKRQGPRLKSGVDGRPLISDQSRLNKLNTKPRDAEIPNSSQASYLLSMVLVGHSPVA